MSGTTKKRTPNTDINDAVKELDAGNFFDAERIALMALENARAPSGDRLANQLNCQWRALRETMLGVPVLGAENSDAAFGAAALALRG